ncbi:hypothetical protein [Pseudomonas savastanoi]|uniref:hypothetical protein n=1 Tax=Pseudomonas savastanoi TaxID=29438 RepID=UPI000EFF17AD|nr:hypothetical protein [Pseudomonas savastanoi]RMQ65450.1 hypothetical protein ALQ01_02558 [Pseudomonas savastanoi pv. glycinea]
MNANFLEILDIRVAYEKAVITNDESTIGESEIEAHIVGAAAQVAGDSVVPELFANVPQLRKSWLEGWEAATKGTQWRRAEDCDLEECTEETMDRDLAEMRALDLAWLDEIPGDQADPEFRCPVADADCFDDDVAP